MSVLFVSAPARPRGLVDDRLSWIDPLVIVAIGAALRIAFFRGALGSDEIVYITQAKYLLHGQFDHSTYIGAIRYGINAFQALSLWLFAASRAGADGLFLGCSLGEILLAYFFSLHLWDRKAAILAALAVAVLPIDVGLAGSLDPDCYLALAIAGSVVIFYFAERRDRWWLYLIAGLLAGWVYWIKEAVIVFGFVFVVLAVAGRRWRSGYLWFATGGLLMLAASLLLFWRVYGDPFYDFHIMQRTVEHGFVAHDIADTSFGTYFVWLFGKIYHVGLLGWIAMAGAVFAVRHRDPGARFVLTWAVALLTIFTALPISLSPLKFIAKQTNYMEIFLLPLALLAGWFVARQRVWVAVLVGGAMIVSGVLLSAMEQQVVRVLTVNARAATDFAKMHPMTPVFGPLSAVRQSGLDFALRDEGGTRGSIRSPSDLADMPAGRGPSDDIVAYVVDDPQMRYLGGSWRRLSDKNTLPAVLRSCMTPEGLLKTADLGLGRYVVAALRSAAVILPGPLGNGVLHATDPFWQVVPGHIYAVTRACLERLRA